MVVEEDASYTKTQYFGEGELTFFSSQHSFLDTSELDSLEKKIEQTK